MLLKRLTPSFLLFPDVPGCCESLTQDEDYDYADGCHPEEADTCFKDVNDNLLCNLGKPIPNKNCTGRNAYDLCEYVVYRGVLKGSMSDALDCCEDIMDTCEESDGLDVFQTDTSAVGLDNATTTNNKTGSKVSNDTENSSTKVTRIPNQASTSRDTNTSTTNIPAVCQTTQDLGKRGTPTASTIVVTVLVTLVLVGLAGLVLVKRGVLTIRTDFDRRLAGLNDGDSSSGYDRF
ncbi:hypothetical protein E2C01_022712 [Portunus trituberculatus]|uniref:Uncharacterized protein n=1 Tax=Portunus trituberculatus TaxID=210409 RepID=A0A5B7E6R6_PORTR|nr:hypothetical protein [Portunus trituberculatus]